MKKVGLFLMALVLASASAWAGSECGCPMKKASADSQAAAPSSPDDQVTGNGGNFGSGAQKAAA
jgi:hypothetical protein